MPARPFRALDGDPSTQVDKTVAVTIDGEPLRRPDGRAPAFAVDGIALSKDGATLYWQALTGAGDALEVVVQDDALVWPDTLSEGPDGTIYVTASHIQDSAWFHPDAPIALPTALYSFVPGE